MNIHAYAAEGQGAKLSPFDYGPKPLGSFDVDIDITHCGICHSDIHVIDNDWGNAVYPVVPGHEIIGTVVGRGDQVKLDIGQRVGVGWQRSACLECTTCLSGFDNQCPSSQATILSHHGGFADKIRTDGRYAFAIPDGLESEGAAPLLCAGATVYSPYVIYGVRPPMRVGVVGIGGLGHLAIKFARAMGCEVVAISHSPEKEAEAKEMGADHFICSKDASAMTQAQGWLDFIVSTPHVTFDYDPFVKMLNVGGKLCIVSAATKPITIQPLDLLFGSRSICGSGIAGRKNMNEMLAFAARHKIHATTETFKMSEVNQAIERVRSGDVRYRAVLVN